MSKNTKKSLDLYKMVEERLEEFEKRVSKIEEKMSEIEDKTIKSFDKYSKYIKLMSESIYQDILISNWTERISALPSGNVSFFDNAIGNIQKKIQLLEQISQLKMEPTTFRPSSQVTILIEIARRWHVPFEDLASYLIQKLGENKARDLVEKQILLQYYGKEIIPIWESLLKK